MTNLNLRPELNDLSLLSLLAAHELERLERSEPSEGEYLSALRDYVAGQMPDPANADMDMKNIAPSKVQLYRRAIYAATNNDPHDFRSLVVELKRLLDQLRTISASTKAGRPPAGADLQSLRLFLISLHGQLLAGKQRTSSNRSSTRFRV